MPNQWFEIQSSGPPKELTLLGESDGEGGYRTLQISSIGDPNLPSTPLIPTLSGSMTTQTSSTLSWSLIEGNRPPVTSWVVERSQSVDDGVSFGSYSAISGSPFSAATMTRVDSSLPIGSPNIVFRYRIAGVNGDGQGDWSSVLPLQYEGNPPAVPAKATNLVAGSITATSATLTWDFPADSTVLKQAIYKNNTLVVDDIDKLAKSYLWSNLTTGVAQSNVNIRRQNSTGWSSPSNYETFTPQASSGFTFAPLIGCSNSAFDHDGTDDWDVWRVYNFNSGNDGGALTIASRTGVNHPKIIGLTEPGLYTSRDSAYNFWKPALEQFYYSNPTTPHPVRSDVELHIANGNEYGADITTNNLAGWVQGCRGIWEATHFENSDGSRRYPLASSWLDPTHEQDGNTIYDNENLGNDSSRIAVGLDVSLYQAVPYIDGVAWSMYPPGRRDSVSDPTLDWPIFDPDQCRDDTLGSSPRQQRSYLMRCFRRTYEAQYPQYNTNISTFKKLKIACWEIGMGQVPDANGGQIVRPYWAAHIIPSMGVCAKIFNLEMTEIIWWDSQKTNNGVIDESEPPNRLSDEQAAGAGEISTRIAWQNWKTYNHFENDSHPSAWPTNPPNTWKNRSDTWKDTWVSDMDAKWPL